MFIHTGGAKGGSIQSGNWHWFADAHRAYEVGSYSSEVDINSKIYAYNSICNTGTYPICVPVRGGVGGIRCGDRANYQLCIGIGHFTSRGPSVQWKVEIQAPSSKLLPAHILVAIHSIPRCRLHENICSTMFKHTNVAKIALALSHQYNSPRSRIKHWMDFMEKHAGNSGISTYFHLPRCRNDGSDCQSADHVRRASGPANTWVPPNAGTRASSRLPPHSPASFDWCDRWLLTPGRLKLSVWKPSDP